MNRSKLIIAITVASLLGSRFVALAQDHTQHHPKHENNSPQSQEVITDMYSCPMHPDVTSEKPGKCPKCEMRLERKSGEQQSMSNMMGKPTFEQSVEGLTVLVWLMTQEEHKKMMAEHMKDSSHEMMSGDFNMAKGMKDNMKDTKHGMMEAMMAGTHHVMVRAMDVATRKAIDSASIKIALTSPSNSPAIVELKKMMNHFGGALSLDETGPYRFDVWVSSKGKTRTVSFSYEVR